MKPRRSLPLLRSLRRGLTGAWLLLAGGGLGAAEPAVVTGLPPGIVVGARPDEVVIIPRLKGVIGVSDPAELKRPAPAGFEGFDASAAPLLQSPEAAEIVQAFLDQPASIPSLGRLETSLRLWLRLRGQSFASVNVPPQEVTGGVIRVVASRARLDGELNIEGARYFSEDSYRAAVPLQPGEEIDAAAVQAGVDRLNRSASRRVTLLAEPGAQAGTTRLVLRTIETKPWQVTAGYDNSGTVVTDEDRLNAGVSWADAFGRGDTLGYTFAADPALEHSISHSANYGTTFASGRTLTVFGAYSTIESALPAPLTQEGASWQLGARHGVPLAKTAGGWERSLSFTADFKYSDNTLEFAAIPITNNATHIAQLGAGYALSHRGGSRTLAFTATLHASPGGLTARNDDAAFDISRAGAKAAYVYGRFDAQFAQRLPRGFSWNTTARAQLASGALLGTEQLGGGGAYAVRGYRESSAYGDDGIVLNNELHLPGFPLAKGRDQADVFAFLDAALLGTRGPGGDTTELASAGIGLNYQFARAFSLRAAYGWTLRDLPAVVTPSGHGHVSASFRY